MKMLNVAVVFCAALAGVHGLVPMYQPNFELSKPLVLPAYEGNFHYTMIEVDSYSVGNIIKPLYGLIGVMLLDGVFTFSGIDERYIPNLERKPFICMPFKGINVVKKCQFDYFLVNADFVDLRKTAFNKDADFDTVCINENMNRPKRFDATLDKNNLLMRFGSRVLMAYKKGSNFNKCIGTYDIEDDLFTCMQPDDNGNLYGREIVSFLHDPITHTRKLDDYTVEVFCKLPHIYNS